MKATDCIGNQELMTVTWVVERVNFVSLFLLLVLAGKLHGVFFFYGDLR